MRRSGQRCSVQGGLPTSSDCWLGSIGVSAGRELGLHVWRERPLVDCAAELLQRGYDRLGFLPMDQYYHHRTAARLLNWGLCFVKLEPF